MAKITDKDTEILDFIYKQLSQNGYPPTVREICTAVNLSSPATVHARLNKLEEAGIIEKSSTKNRTMRLVNYTPKDIAEPDDTKEDYIDVPVYGKITAGVPITAVEQLERHMLTDEAFILLEGHAKLYDEENVYEMETGKIYNFRKGEYHHVTIEEDGLVMVVENVDTCPDNTEKRAYKC